MDAITSSSSVTLSSAVDDEEALQQVQEITKRVEAVLTLQKHAREAGERRDADAVAVQEAAVLQGDEDVDPLLSPDEEEEDDDDDDGSKPFTIRNLDTGESICVDEAGAAGSAGADALRLKLASGTLQPNTSAWESTKAECRGLLEKLASTSSLSFKTYQLCVWQERYVYAEDAALCYKQLNKEHVPAGKSKRIPFEKIQFVGAADENQFVIRLSLIHI